MPNDDYHLVVDAVSRIQHLSDDHWRVLDASWRALDDDAWVGPAGRRFKEEVYAQRQELRAQLTKAVQSARHKLRHVSPRR